MTELALRAPARCMWFARTVLRPPVSFTVRSHGQVMAAGQHRHPDSCCLFHLTTPLAPSLTNDARSDHRHDKPRVGLSSIAARNGGRLTAGANIVQTEGGDCA